MTYAILIVSVDRRAESGENSSDRSYTWLFVHADSFGGVAVLACTALAAILLPTLDAKSYGIKVCRS